MGGVSRFRGQGVARERKPVMLRRGGVCGTMSETAPRGAAMTTTKRKATASNIPPDADPGVPPDVFAMLMANPPTEEEKAQ